MSELNYDALVQAVVSGTATEEQTGSVLKTLKNQLSVHLLDSLRNGFQSIDDLAELAKDAVVQFKDRYEESAGLLGMEPLFKFIKDIQDKQFKLLDLYYKVATGPQLFAADTLSIEEKQILRLFKSFRTQEEKNCFLRLVQTELAKIENDA